MTKTFTAVSTYRFAKAALQAILTFGTVWCFEFWLLGFVWCLVFVICYFSITG